MFLFLIFNRASRLSVDSDITIKQCIRHAIYIRNERILK